jgi:hypothetical protein
MQYVSSDSEGELTLSNGANVSAVCGVPFFEDCPENVTVEKPEHGALQNRNWI